MLTEERYGAILKYLEANKVATVPDLAALLNTSDSTIRRDLTALHTLGRLNKVHGGATLLSLGTESKESSIKEKISLNPQEKAAIGKYAASLLENDDFVYIDAGTSTAAMIEFITEKNAVYVTNGITHAERLADMGFQVYLIGGRVKMRTGALIGTEACEALKKYHFTKGFFGVNGISIEAGFTTPEISEASVKQQAFHQSAVCYVLADPTKFNMIAPVTFGQLEEGIILTTACDDKRFFDYTEVKEVSKI